MSGTAVPQPTLGPVGYVAPAAPAVLAGVQADQVAAMGSDLNPSLSTPQGQLAQSEAAIIADMQSQFLWWSQQTDPAYAEGRPQDAIARYYFINRIPGTPTVATCQCVGVGAVIPQGAVVIAADSNTYTATSSGTLPTGVGGTITLSFGCTVDGPIACPAQTFTLGEIIGGWESCTSVSSGIPGQNVETSQEFEIRRGLTVEGNSVNVNNSIMGTLLGGNGGMPVTGVTSAYVTDNSAGTSTVVGGVTLSANSLYVCVNSSADTLAVATAIWNKKSPGCAWDGSTTVTITDPNPLYNGAGPSYAVKFQQAAALTINGAVSIPNTVFVPSNAGALVTGAFQAAFTGADGLTPAGQIGATTYAGRFYNGIQALGAWAENIISLQIGTSTANTSTVACNIDHIPTAGTIALTLV